MPALRFGERDGVFIADFDREASSFSEALVCAIKDVERAVPGLRVVRVEPEDLVTASEIAARTGRTRESVRQLFEGARGPGDFPRPAAWLSDRTRLWHWSDVSRWFATALNEGANAPEDADLVALANAVLTLHHFAGRYLDQSSNRQEASSGRSESSSITEDWLAIFVGCELSENYYSSFLALLGLAERRAREESIVES
jgi:hypothetical protein